MSPRLLGTSVLEKWFGVVATITAVVIQTSGPAGFARRREKISSQRYTQCSVV